MDSPPAATLCAVESRRLSDVSFFADGAAVTEVQVGR